MAKALQSIQVLRGVAAKMVVFFHAPLILQKVQHSGLNVFGGAFSIGYAGVDIFFVLSGFIILSAHQRHMSMPSELLRYARRRFVRLYPIYWLYLTGMIALLLAGFGTMTTAVTPNYLFSSYTLIRTSAEAPPLSVAWSLYHEVLFYAVFALFILRKELGVAVFLAWMGFTLVCYATGLSEPFRPHENMLGVVGSLFNLNFAFGMLAFLAAAKLPTAHYRTALAAGLVILSATAAIAYGDHAQEWRLGFGVGSLFLILGLILMERRRPIEAPRWLVFLGDASYSIYLVHYPVLAIVIKLLNATGMVTRLGLEVVFVLSSAVAIGTGCLAYYFVEKQILARLGSGSGGRKAAPDAEPAARVAIAPEAATVSADR